MRYLILKKGLRAVSAVLACAMLAASLPSPVFVQAFALEEVQQEALQEVPAEDAFVTEDAKATQPTELPDAEPIEASTEDAVAPIEMPAEDVVAPIAQSIENETPTVQTMSDTNEAGYEWYRVEYDESFNRYDEYYFYDYCKFDIAQTSGEVFFEVVATNQDGTPACVLSDDNLEIWGSEAITYRFGESPKNDGKQGVWVTLPTEVGVIYLYYFNQDDISQNAQMMINVIKADTDWLYENQTHWWTVGIGGDFATLLDSDGVNAWAFLSAEDLPISVSLKDAYWSGNTMQLTEETLAFGEGIDVAYAADGKVTIAPRTSGTHELVYTDPATQQTSTLRITIADAEEYQPTVSINGIKDMVQYYGLSYGCYDWTIDLTEYQPEVFLWANDTSVYENAVALTLENCTILENTAGARLDEGEHDYYSGYYTGVYVMAAHAGSVTVQCTDPNDESVTGQVTITFIGDMPAVEQDDTVEYWWNIYGTTYGTIYTETVGDVTSAAIDATQLPVRLSLYADSYSVEFKRLSEFTYDADAVELFISEGELWVMPKQNGETTISYLDVRTGRMVSFVLTFAEIETYVTSYRWNYTIFDLDGNYRNNSGTSVYFTVYPASESLRVFLSLTQLSLAHPDIVLTEGNVTAMASMNLTIENGTYDGEDGIWVEADDTGRAYLIYTNPEDETDASMVQINFGGQNDGYYTPAAYEWRVNGGDSGYSTTFANIGTEGYTILSGADFLLSVSLIDTDYSNYRFTDIDNFTFSEGLSYQFTEGGSITITLWAQEDGVYTMSYTDDTLGETYTLTLVLRNTDCFAPELGWYSTIQSYHTPTWWDNYSGDERTIARADFMPSMFITITDVLDSMDSDGTSFDFENLTVVEGSIAVEIEEGEDPDSFHDRQGVWVIPLESGDLTLQYTEPDGYQRTTTMVIHFTGEPSGTMPDVLDYAWAITSVGSGYVQQTELSFNEVAATLDASQAPFTLSLTGSWFYPVDFSVDEGSFIYDKEKLEVVVNPDNSQEIYLMPKEDGEVTLTYTDDATSTTTSFTLTIENTAAYQTDSFWFLERDYIKGGWMGQVATTVTVINDDTAEKTFRISILENSMGTPSLGAENIEVLEGSIGVSTRIFDECLYIGPNQDGYLYLRYTNPDDPTDIDTITICIGAEPTVEALQAGDVSGDGNIGIDDGIMLAQYLAGTRGLSPQAQAAADCNGADGITTQDVETILAYGLPSQ